MASDDGPKERWRKQAQVRDDQAEVRENQAEVREDQAEVREDQSDMREDESEVRERQAEDREVEFDVQHHRLERMLKVITFIAVLLFVGTILSFTRQTQITSAVNTLDDKTTALETQTNVARDAAVNARDILNHALAEAEARRIEGGDGSSPAAIREALASVARIERHLCGGPC